MPPRQGAFADYKAMPSTNLIPIPDDLSTTKAALAESLAPAWHVVLIANRLSYRPLTEAKAFVIGAGAVGLGSALALKALRRKDISVAETNQIRCETSAQAGIEFVFDPTKENNLTDGSMDVINDAVESKESRKTAI